MKPITALLLASAALLPAAPQHMLDHPPAPDKVEVADGGASLPMDDIGGRPILQVSINGKGPFPFILDTGASTSVIDSELRTELGLSSTGVKAAMPVPGFGDVVRIDRLTAGGVTVSGLIAAVGPVKQMFSGQGEPRGVLSAAIFPGSLLVLDYPAKRIFIRKGALPPADARSIFQYTEAHILPNIPVRVAGTEVRVHVDSGSPSSLTLPTKYMKELPMASEPVQAGHARTHAGEFTIWRAPVKGNIELGKFPLDLTSVEFADVNPISGQIVGNIGYRVLKQFVVTMDSLNRRIQFER